MPSIFISYRRSDSHADAGRVYDRLVAHFGKGAVFKDVDDIPPGVDFRDYLNQTLTQCQVLLAIMGPGWLNAEDGQGKRRLDNPGDWVRVEIEEALRRQDVLVVPVLVSHAQMPRADELPGDLQNLAFRNYREARPDPDFHRDINRLINELERFFQPPQAHPEQSSFPKRLTPDPSVMADKPSQRQPLLTIPQRPWLKWAGISSLVLLLGGVAAIQAWQNQPAPDSSVPETWGSNSQTEDTSGWGATESSVPETWGSNSQTEDTSGWGATESTSPDLEEDIPRTWGNTTADPSPDFDPLENLLRLENWEEADQATLDIMLQMTNQQEQGWLDGASLQRFPCDALETLDQLWAEASDGKFGFSVQHNLYTSTCSKIAATDGINQDSYACFIDQVGWTRVWDTAQDDLQVTYNVDAPAGHLPWKALCGPDYCDASQDELNRYWALQSRLTSCQSK